MSTIVFVKEDYQFSPPNSQKLTLITFKAISYAIDPVLVHLDSHKSNYIRLACLCLLRCRADDFMVVIGIKCASFSKMNRGTSQRAECCSVGQAAHRSVAEANCLLERPGFVK